LLIFIPQVVDPMEASEFEKNLLDEDETHRRRVSMEFYLRFIGKDRAAGCCLKEKLLPFKDVESRPVDDEKCEKVC
jgi:hypothetical protein